MKLYWHDVNTKYSVENIKLVNNGGCQLKWIECLENFDVSFMIVISNSQQKGCTIALSLQTSLRKLLIPSIAINKSVLIRVTSYDGNTDCVQKRFFTVSVKYDFIEDKTCKNIFNHSMIHIIDVKKFHVSEKIFHSKVGLRNKHEFMEQDAINSTAPNKVAKCSLVKKKAEGRQDKKLPNVLQWYNIEIFQMLHLEGNVAPPLFVYVFFRWLLNVIIKTWK